MDDKTGFQAIPNATVAKLHETYTRKGSIKQGDKYGRLTALACVGPNTRGALLSIWLCDCGSEIQRTASSVKDTTSGGWLASCGCTSRKGKRREYPRLDLTERFLRHVNKTDDCWLWTGATSAGGYGKLGFVARGKCQTLVASRVAYELFVGPIASGLFVCHRCDNRLCVRPDHLFVGTARDNAIDMFQKGRGRPAGKASAICAADVARIKALPRSTPFKRHQSPIPAIAAELGVSTAHVYSIRKGKRPR